MNKNTIKIGLAGFAVMLTGCDSYLDKQPSVSTNAPLTEVDQLISMFDYTTNVQEYSYPDSYCTDDYGVPMDMYKARPTSFSNTNMCFYTLESKVMESSANNNSWKTEYSKVFTANTMIEQAQALNGDKETAEEALACGYFMRAWSMFRLAVIHCLPYSEANLSQLGLPTRYGTLFTEDVSRSTLGETFDQILSDFKEAEKHCAFDNVRSDFRWRVSKCAIYGALARVYLYMNDYSNASTYVDKALALAPQLYDYNNLTWGNPSTYKASGSYPAEVVENCITHSWTLKNIYNEWSEWIFIRLSYLGTQWLSPSQSLLDTYDEKDTDLRYVYFMAEHGNRRFSVLYDWYRYNQFYDGSYAITGLTTSELILMKAELQARNGDAQGAMATLVPLRQARFENGAANTLTAANASDALKQVLKERRREFPFTLRLMDIKRFAVSSTADDDVTISREFFVVTNSGVDASQVVQVTAKGDDPRLAIPVPGEDIDNSQGAIVQNPF